MKRYSLLRFVGLCVSAFLLGAGSKNAAAGVLDNQSLTVSTYIPGADGFVDVVSYPTPVSTTYASAPLSIGGADISFGLNEEALDSGIYEDFYFPNLTITGVDILQNGVEPAFFGGATFDPSRITFDANDVFVDITGRWLIDPTLGYGGQLEILQVDVGSPVPEPASIALLAAGLGGLGLLRHVSGDARSRASA